MLILVCTVTGNSQSWEQLQSVRVGLAFCSTPHVLWHSRKLAKPAWRTGAKLISIFLSALRHIQRAGWLYPQKSGLEIWLWWDQKCNISVWLSIEKAVMAGHIVWEMTQFAHPPHFCVATARFPFIHFGGSGVQCPMWPMCPFELGKGVKLRLGHQCPFYPGLF